MRVPVPGAHNRQVLKVDVRGVGKEDAVRPAVPIAGWRAQVPVKWSANILSAGSPYATVAIDRPTTTDGYVGCIPGEQHGLVHQPPKNWRRIRRAAVSWPHSGCLLTRNQRQLSSLHGVHMYEVVSKCG
eukprot:COSAG02_NODE_10129_length_2014_cov_7.665405_2_plen_129_part_00